MTCNYDSTNLGGMYIYMIGGPPASDCSFYGGVPSTKYENLCTNDGKIYAYNQNQLLADTKKIQDQFGKGGEAGTP